MAAVKIANFALLVSAFIAGLLTGSVYLFSLILFTGLSLLLYESYRISIRRGNRQVLWKAFVILSFGAIFNWLVMTGSIPLFPERAEIFIKPMTWILTMEIPLMILATVGLLMLVVSSRKHY